MRTPRWPGVYWKVITHRGHTFFVSARSEQAFREAVATVKAYAATLVPIV